MGRSADVQPYGVRRRHPVRQFRQPHDAGRPGTWLQPFSGRLKQTWNNSTASRNRPHSLTCTVTVWHSLTSASEPARAPLLAQIRLSYNPTGEALPSCKEPDHLFHHGGVLCLVWYHCFLLHWSGSLDTRLERSSIGSAEEEYRSLGVANLVIRHRIVTGSE